MMKLKICLIFFLFSILFCNAQKVAENNNSYNDAVEFSIIRLRTSKFVEYGNGGDQKLHVAIKNSTFKILIVEFRNNSEKEIEIDFEKFFLIDGNGEKHTVESVTPYNGAGTTVENFQKKIKSGKTRAYVIGFAEPFSKVDTTNKLMVDGKLIEFAFK